MKEKALTILFSLCLLFVTTTRIYSQIQQSQKGIVSGKVLDLQKEPIYPATVYIKGTSIWQYTNEDGTFRLTNIPRGNNILVISGVGFKEEQQEITIEANTETVLPDIIIDATLALNEVVVTGKSVARQQQEQAFAVSVMDISTLHNTSADVAALTNKMAGVRIREEGGVGSNYSFTLNGFSGRQVKFFMDGLSIDNSGASFGLNNLPSNMVERVEVYKGVLPVGLGADALGGAVNIITRKNPKYLDASYSFGSFNTHKASINGAYTDPKTGYTVRINSYFNHSDNDYKVNAPIIDLSSGQKLGTQKVKRFHDGYESFGMRFETGFVDRSFADYLLVGLIASENEKDIQNGVVMDLVYGARTSDSKSLIPSLRYKKNNLFADGLGVSFYGAYSHVDYNSIDTIPRTYNWLGEFKDKPAGSGERNRSQLNILTKEWKTNTNVDYTLDMHHTITLNHVYSNLKRETSDVEDPANEYNKIPQSIDKHILGMGWMTKYDRWNATVFGKMYRMTGKTYETNPYTTGLEKVSKDFTEFGYGTAATYFILSKLQAKISYEHTYRLPEAFEMFGDGQENSRNADLKPESSHNFNLGVMYEFDFLRDNTLQTEANFLFRDSKDFIHKELKQPSMRYLNLGKVQTKGIEANVKYSWKNLIHAGANATYQHITDNQKRTPSQTIGGTDNENFNYKEKLPNIPYLFGNLNLGFNKHDMWIKRSEFRIDYFLNYVKEYYLSWPSLGIKDSKDEIPRQLSHDIAASLSLQNGRYNVSVECNNITDEELYDNFKLPKPGRAFNIKLRYYINK